LEGAQKRDRPDATCHKVVKRTNMRISEHALVLMLRYMGVRVATRAIAQKCAAEEARES